MGGLSVGGCWGWVCEKSHGSRLGGLVLGGGGGLRQQCVGRVGLSWCGRRGGCEARGGSTTFGDPMGAGGCLQG